MYCSRFYDVVNALVPTSVGHVEGHRRAGTARRAAVSSTDVVKVCSTATAWGWRPHAASPSVSRDKGVGGEQHTEDHLRLSRIMCAVGLFVQVTVVSQAGLVKLRHRLDGTKVKANASHKAMSYGISRSWRRR